jgi:hypothetical protein
MVNHNRSQSGELRKDYFLSVVGARKCTILVQKVLNFCFVENKGVNWQLTALQSEKWGSRDRFQQAMCMKTNELLVAAMWQFLAVSENT